MDPHPATPPPTSTFQKPSEDTSYFSFWGKLGSNFLGALKTPSRPSQSTALVISQVCRGLAVDHMAC